MRSRLRIVTSIAMTTGWIAFLAIPARPAWAIRFQLGPVTGSLDNTVSLGSSFRLRDRALTQIGRSQGGTGFSVNGDDGNLNYDPGVVAAAGKITHDLQLDWRDFAAFVRTSYFYDVENQDRKRARRPLADPAKALVGKDARLLDAFVRAGFKTGGRPVDLRVGWQVVNWGESSFLTNGINVANPADVAKLRVPGSELREALLGIPIVRGSAGIVPGLTVEGFYALQWQKTDIDPPGSYFSTNDFAGDGGQFVVLGFGGVSDVACPTAVCVPRGPDRDPKDSGQYGMALRWFSPLLDTEFGWYHVNYHSKLPIVSAKAVTVILPGPTPVPSSARYFIEYPQDIKVYGVSFNTDLFGTGVALQGEYSLHQDEPLQVDDVELLLSALFSPASQLGPAPGPGAEVSGFRRLDVSQWQFTTSKAFGPTLVANEWILLGEVGFTKVHDLPDPASLRFEGPGTPLPGSAAVASANSVPVQTDGFATSFSWGYRLISRVDFESVIGAVGFSPRFAFAHDVSGVAPVPAGNFIEGRKAVTVALAANYLASWSADLSYTNFFHGGTFNQLRDRDFISVAIKYAF